MINAVTLNMKVRIYKLKNWLLMTLMGVLGLSACHSSKEATQPPIPDEPKVDNPQPRDEKILMYGVPTMNFTVKGKVVNEAGEPVKGMQVILLNRNIDITPEDMHEDNPYVRDYLRHSADTTDAEGLFRVQTTDTPTQKEMMIVRDIDGEENGAYEDQMFDVSFDNAKETQQRQGWNMGAREQELDITVVKKQ